MSDAPASIFSAALVPSTIPPTPMIGSRPPDARAIYRMIPMSEALFQIEEQSHVRIRFKKEAGQVTGLTALYSDGNSAEYARNE